MVFLSIALENKVHLNLLDKLCDGYNPVLNLFLILVLILIKETKDEQL
jgi:hypothetical protein